MTGRVDERRSTLAAGAEHQPGGAVEPDAWQSRGPKGKWHDDPMGFDVDFRTKTEATGLHWRPLYAHPSGGRVA